MKTLKTTLCIIIWAILGWIFLHKLSQGYHDENVIARMPQSTYDEIVDSFTVQYGFKPSEHQIVTYYYKRYAK